MDIAETTYGYSRWTKHCVSLYVCLTVYETWYIIE